MGSQVQERMIYALNKSSIECLDANLWSYTRLGKIDDLSDWEDALGNGDIPVTFSLE